MEVLIDTLQTVGLHKLYNVCLSFLSLPGESLPAEIQRLMKWKLSTITPLVVRRTLINSGFRLVRSTCSRRLYASYCFPSNIL